MLTREELDEIALKVADTFIEDILGGKREFGEVFIFTETEFQRLTHALLCKVQKRINPLGTAAQLIDDYVLAKSGLSDDVHLTTLPLIEE